MESNAATVLKTTLARDQADWLRLQVELQADVARAVTADAADLQALLAPAADTLATRLDADVVAVWTADPKTSELRLVVTAGVEGAPVARPRVNIGEAYVTALSTAARPSVFIDPPFEQPLFAAGLSSGRRGTSVCPLVLDGQRLVGVLAMVRSVPLQSGEEQAFASVADQVALAIEKERALRGLRETEDGLDILIRTAPDAIVVMDARSRIVATNPSLDRIFGYEAGELIGLEVTALMPERLRARHHAGVRRYQETGERRISWHGVELIGLKKDGTEFPIEISFGEYAQGGRQVFTGFMRDISDRKRAEGRDRRRRRMIQTSAVYVGSSWVALEAADLLIPVLPFPAWTFRLLVLVALLGLPVALALAWSFEFSRTGMRRAARLPSSHQPAAAHARGSLRLMRTSLSAAVLVLLLLVPVLMGPLSNRVRPARPEISIAVLPFEDVTARPYVLLGLTDEVIAQLVALPHVRVSSRTTMLATVRTPKPVRQIGRELDASHVLQGSVRRSGNRLRVTVQLMVAASEQHVWSATYEHSGTDVLGIESEIARNIGLGLRTTFQNPE